MKPFIYTVLTHLILFPSGRNKRAVLGVADDGGQPRAQNKTAFENDASRRVHVSAVHGRQVAADERAGVHLSHLVSKSDVPNPRLFVKRVLVNVLSMATTQQFWRFRRGFDYSRALSGH